MSGCPPPYDRMLHFTRLADVTEAELVILREMVSPATNDTESLLSEADRLVSLITTSREVGEPFFIRVIVRLLPAPGAVFRATYSLDRVKLPGTTLATNASLASQPPLPSPITDM
jgi:hypothetical protein